VEGDDNIGRDWVGNLNVHRLHGLSAQDKFQQKKDNCSDNSDNKNECSDI
jgi:hypothetical protein